MYNCVINEYKQLLTIMKDEILQALKTKYSNLGFRDKAFEATAELLATTVTDKAQIETAIAGVDNLLKAFQGEKDSLRTENVILKKQLEDRGNEDKQPKKDDSKKKDEKEFLTREDLLSALKDFQKEQSEKNQKNQEYAAKIDSVKAELSNKGIKESAFKMLLKNIEKAELLSKEELSAAIEKDYDALRSDITPEAGKPKMSTLGNGEQVPSDIADFIKGKEESIKAAQSTEKKLV